VAYKKGDEVRAPNPEYFNHPMSKGTFNDLQPPLGWDYCVTLCVIVIRKVGCDPNVHPYLLSVTLNTRFGVVVFLFSYPSSLNPMANRV
jgi:hypothetical protein